MRRVGFVVVVAALFGSMIGGAAASLDQEQPTDINPLIDLVADIEAGTAGDLVVAAGDGPIVSQFQTVVNLGQNPMFFDGDLGVTPIGYDSSGAIVDLTDFLGPNLALARQVPPLHPGRNVVDVDGQPRFDLATAFPGWEAFGEFGPIDGPVPAIAGNTMLWGFELAQPFDTSCATAAAVGRAWESESLVSANAPFEADALNEIWPSTHDALADGTLGRLIQLNCDSGGEPAIQTVRMNPDFGRVRAFGPLEIVALVKDNHVVFAGALRETEGHANDVTFFATGLSGAVETMKGEGPIAVLVPNPYEGVPVRIDFNYDVDSIEPIGTALEGETVPLLWRAADTQPASPGGPLDTRIGFSCSLGMLVAYMDAAGEAIFSTGTSVWREVEATADLISSLAAYADGSSDELLMHPGGIDPAGTFVLVINSGPSSDQPDCAVEGTYDLTCVVGTCDGLAPPPVATAADECMGDECDGSSPAAAATDVDTAPGSAAGESDGGGGPPVVPIGAGAAVAAGAVVLWTRGRKETPGLPADAEHYDRDADGNIVLPENLSFLPDQWPTGCDSSFDPETGRFTVVLPPGLRKVPAPGARQPSQGPDASAWGPEEARAWYEATIDDWLPEGERSPHIGENFRISNSKGQATVEQRVFKADGTTSWKEAPESEAVGRLRNAYNSMIENADLWNQNASSPDYAAEFARLSEGRQQDLIDALQELVNDPGLSED